MSKTALVTGASSGIGNDLARLFAADGIDLVLVARREDKLQQLAEELKKNHSIQTHIIAQDLSQPQSGQRIYQHLQDKNLAIDYLVNNAGFGLNGFFSGTSWETESQMMQLNMVTLTELTKLFLPGMIQRKHGRILSVASTAAFQAGPRMAVYYASKSYVLMFSEAIANELKGTGVTVTCLCPGLTQTQFISRAKVEGTTLSGGKLIPIHDSKSVAAKGYRGMMRGKTLVIPGFMNNLLVQSVRISPRKLAAAVVRKIMDK